MVKTVVEFVEDAVEYIETIEALMAVAEEESDEYLMDLEDLFQDRLSRGGPTFGADLSDYGIRVKEQGDNYVIVDKVDKYRLGAESARPGAVIEDANEYSFGKKAGVKPGSKISWIGGGGIYGGYDEEDYVGFDAPEALPIDIYQGYITEKQKEGSEDIEKSSFEKIYGDSDGRLNSKDLLPKLTGFLFHTIDTECKLDPGDDESNPYQGTYVEFVGGPTYAGKRRTTKKKKKKKKKKHKKQKKQTRRRRRTRTQGRR